MQKCQKSSIASEYNQSKYDYSIDYSINCIDLSISQAPDRSPLQKRITYNAKMSEVINSKRIQPIQL